MAWELGDGFDFYGSGGNGPTQGGTCWASSLVNVVGVAQSRFGVGQGTQLASGNQWVTNAFGNDAVLYINFAISAQWFNTGLTTTEFGFTLYDGTNAQVGVYFRQNGSLIITNGLMGGTTIAGPTTPWFTAASQWHHFQFKVTINNTTGRVEMRQDGHAADDYDSGPVLNTRNGSTNAYCNKLIFNQTDNATFLDDFYLFNDQGAAPNTWQGDVRAVQLMPSSDSSVTWTRSTGATNASCVDEPSETGDTDYVSTLTVNAVDQYGTAALATTPNAIIGVVTKALVRMDDVGPHSCKTRLTSNAVTGDSATLSLSSSYQWIWSNYITDPSGGAAWTAARVNAATIGPFCVS
jgi:hypothetical protein